MPIQKIRLKAFFLFCIIFLISKQTIASNNFASYSSRDQVGSPIFEQYEVQRAISRFCRILLLNPKNKTAQENFKAITAYPDLTAKQRSKVYLLEDLLSAIKNLKKRIKYLTSKRDLLKSRLIKKGYDKEQFFQDSPEIKKNIFRSHETVRYQEKPYYDQNDPLTFINRRLTDEKGQLFVHVQYLQKQYQWLRTVSKHQKSSVPQPFIDSTKIITSAVSGNIAQSETNEYSIDDFGGLNFGKDHSMKGTGDEQWPLEDDDRPETTTNIIYVRPKVIDGQLEQIHEIFPRMTSLPVKPAHHDEESNIGEDIRDYQSERFKEKDNKINELSGEVVDLSLKMSETEMILNEKIEAITSLKKNLVEVEQRFMLEQKIIREKNKEMQSLQDTLDRFQLKTVDQIEKAPGARIFKNGQLAGIEASLKDYQDDLEKSDDLIKGESKNIKVLERALVNAQLRLEWDQKTIHEKSEKITALQNELTSVQLKARKRSNEVDALLMKKDREIKELNAFLNIYKYSLRNSNQMIKEKSEVLVKTQHDLLSLKVQLADIQNELLKLKDQSNPVESQGPVIENKVQELRSKFQDIQHFLLENRHDSDRINTHLAVQ